MNSIRRWMAGLFAGLVLSGLMMGCKVALVGATGMQGQAAKTDPAQGENELLIENDSELPETYPQADYQFFFRARGGVPALHWRLEKGALPPGMNLDGDGLLHGKAERVGEFEF